MTEAVGLRRRVRAEEPQQALFELPPDWRAHWWGMPAFEQKDARPAHRITVNFICEEDVAEFARRLGLKSGPRTDSLWFPKEQLDRPNEWEYRGEP